MVFSYLITKCLGGYVYCHISLGHRPIALACALPRGAQARASRAKNCKWKICCILKYIMLKWIYRNIIYSRKVGEVKYMTSKNEKIFDVSFSMVNEYEYKLIINAIKRQVDYYRNRVFNQCNVLSESQLNWSKHNYTIYNDLYNKIIQDYDNVVKVGA